MGRVLGFVLFMVTGVSGCRQAEVAAGTADIDPAHGPAEHEPRLVPYLLAHDRARMTLRATR